MGSVNENAEISLEAVVNTGGDTGVPVPSAPSAPSATVGGGTPPPPGAPSPKDVAGTPPDSPEQKQPEEEVVDESAEHLAKRARLDEECTEIKSVLRKFLKMSKSMEVASQALSTTNQHLTDHQKELDRLSTQLGLDQDSARWQLATLQTFCNKIESVEWQVSGGKRTQHPTPKEVTTNVGKELKAMSTVLEQTKRENRVQSDLLLTHVKSMEEAFKTMASSLSQLSLITNSPGGVAMGAPSTELQLL